MMNTSRQTKTENNYFIWRFLIEFFLSILFFSNLICTQNIPNDEENENSKALSSLYHILQSIFHNFPICQWKEFYLNFVESPSKLAKIKTEASAESGIFEIVLNLLNDLIYQNEEGRIATSKSDCGVNIRLFAASSFEDEKSSFINLTRDEKFERIILVLGALAGLFEQDLAMFATRYSGKLSSSISKSSHRPLICSAIWKSYESVTVINQTIKIIISVYCDMIALGYPRATVKIVARFLNLISHVVNIFECSDESTFPSYSSYTMDFVREIHKKVIDNFHSSSCHHPNPSFYADAIDNLRSPLIKMLLANEILQNLHKSNFYPVSLSTPLKLIRKKEFLKFNSTRMPRGNDGKSREDVDSAGNENSNASNKVENGNEDEAFGMMKAKRRKEMRSDEKYPVLSQTRRAIKAEITEDCYLKLLLLLSSSINHFYRLISCYREVKVLQQRSRSTSTSSQVAAKVDSKIFSDSSLKLDMKPLQPQPEILLNGQSHTKGEQNSNNNEFNEKLVDRNEEVVTRRIYLVPKKSVSIKLSEETIVFYCDEMNKLSQLTSLIKKCHEEHGEKFDEWLKFVERIEWEIHFMLGIMGKREYEI